MQIVCNALLLPGYDVHMLGVVHPKMVFSSLAGRMNSRSLSPTITVSDTRFPTPQCES
jgi:hypothetical protein